MLRAGEAGDTVARAFSEGVEALIGAAAPEGSGVAVLAQGGLARRDLVPFSDVDVLIVVDGDAAAAGERATRPLYALWDAGFRVGHAVRGVDELPSLFERLSAKDGHAATALLEARPIAGDLALAERALRHVRRELFPARRGALLDEKLRELHARRERFGGSPWQQEPDLKSGPGGLRDLQALLWIGLLHAGEGARDPSGDLLAGLLGVGLLHPREAAALKHGRRELLALRAALHVAVGRADDRLHGENAGHAAPLLDTSPGHAGETAAEALCRRAVTAMALVKRTVDDALARLQPRPARVGHRDLGGGFVDVDGELHFHADASLDLAAIVEAARLMSEHDLVAADAFTARRSAALTERAAEPDERARRAAARALLRLCSSTSAGPDADGHGPFTRLLEWGALPRILVEVERLHARVKLDGVHALTTDAHLARCADLALFLVSGASPPPAPLLPSAGRTTRTHIVVLSALFHDMGKGLVEDHSVVGARVVGREAGRMGLPADDAELLRFLVLEHLVLSRASQRRDLSDPVVIDELSAAVRTPERLDLLALLTWVDMCAVAPGVGTAWKARLLGTAVERAREALLSPGAAVARTVDEEVRRAARAALAGVRDDVAARFVDGATTSFLASRSEDELRDDAAAYAQAFVGVPVAGDVDAPPPSDQGRDERGPIAVVVRAALETIHEVRLVARDRPGLLADLAAALASEGANVLGATLDVRSDGLVLDAFIVDDSRGHRLVRETAARLPAALAAAARPRAPGAPAPPRGGFIRPTRVAPRVRVLPSDSWGRTVVEVRAADRLGLLADLARAFAARGFTIALARIHTEGPRVTDVFTVERDDEGGTSAAELAAMERALLAAIAPS